MVIKYGSGRGTKIMKAFIIACAAAIIIAIIGVFVLNSVQEPVSQAFATQYVRV